MKNSIIVKAIEAPVSDGQETLAGNRRTTDKFIKVKFEELQKQIDDSIVPLMETIKNSKIKKESKGNLSKVTVKVGFSLKGDVVLVSGEVGGAIELEFTDF